MYPRLSALIYASLIGEDIVRRRENVYTVPHSLQLSMTRVSNQSINAFLRKIILFIHVHDVTAFLPTVECKHNVIAGQKLCTGGHQTHYLHSGDVIHLQLRYGSGYEIRSVVMEVVVCGDRDGDR